MRMGDRWVGIGRTASAVLVLSASWNRSYVKIRVLPVRLPLRGRPRSRAAFPTGWHAPPCSSATTYLRPNNADRQLFGGSIE